MQQPPRSSSSCSSSNAAAGNITHGDVVAEARLRRRDPLGLRLRVDHDVADGGAALGARGGARLRRASASGVLARARVGGRGGGVRGGHGCGRSSGAASGEGRGRVEDGGVPRASGLVSDGRMQVGLEDVAEARADLHDLREQLGVGGRDERVVHDDDLVHASGGLPVVASVRFLLVELPAEGAAVDGGQGCMGCRAARRWGGGWGGRRRRVWRRFHVATSRQARRDDGCICARCLLLADSYRRRAPRRLPSRPAASALHHVVCVLFGWVLTGDG